MARRQFGSIRRLPSGRFQAKYALSRGTVVAPSTFSKKLHAESWLVDERRRLDTAVWNPAAATKPEQVTFSAYADRWLDQRRVQGRPLKPGPLEQHRNTLAKHLLPQWGNRELSSITSAEVKSWYAGLMSDAPSYRALCYRLFRSIMRTAFSDDLIPADVCRVTAGRVNRTHRIITASMHELEVATDAMPEHLRLAVPLAAWCALRSGEIRELRRHDFDTDAQVVHIRRAVVHLKSGHEVVPPKSAAGLRSVAVPPHLMEMVEEHLTKYVGTPPDSLVFPATVGSEQHLSSWSLNHRWQHARTQANRPDLRFHDLRHTGAVFAAQSGATTAELMGRLGHSSPDMAMNYQHVARGRDAEIAALLSKMAENG